MSFVKIFGSVKVLRFQNTTFRLLSTQTQVKKKSISFQEEWNNAKKFEEIPKLTAFQFIRSVLPGGKYYGLDLGELIDKLNEKFGDITVIPGIMGRPQVVQVFQPQDFEKVLRNDSKWPFRRGLESFVYYRNKKRSDVYEEYGSLISEQDEKWYKTRTLVNPIMMKPQISKLYVPQIDEIADEFIEVMKRLRDDKNELPPDFGDYTNHWSLESITFITLSKRLGLLRENYSDPNAEKLIKGIRHFFVSGFEFEFKPSIWKLYQTKGFKELIQAYDDITESILYFVEDAIENLKKQPPKEDQEESILEKTLKIDKKLAVVTCIDSLLAGVDTTSAAFLSILYCLAKNPEKQQTLRDEIMTIIPNKTDKLTVENMKNLPYLRAVIKEGLRLYSPAFGTIRRTERDLVLNGYQVPKGQEVMLLTLKSGQKEENFQRSKEFIPERFLKDNNDPQCPHAKTSHPFSYIPFGFGSRMCIGRRFAELEIETMLIKTIRNFKVEWHYPDMKMKSVLVNMPSSEMRFRLIDI